MKKGKIPTELLRRIKETVNILEVVGEHVVLRKTGANHVGLCPFHSERTPSFSVSETKQLYHCYGCKRGGDVVTFIMELQGVSFPETIEDLADRAKISLPKEWEGPSAEADKKHAERREKQNLAFKLNRFAASFFHQTLAQDFRAQEYYNSRGINSEWIKAFYLGSVSDSWDSLAKHLVAKKAPIELAVELGLIRPSTQAGSQRGMGYFDLFRNRCVFPIVNLRGKVAGFGGRILGQDTPKYLNSPESLIFQKSKLAFGLFQAQKYIREHDEIILVEGYFDVLAMHRAGFRNVVATCGTSLTLDHLQLFKRLANKVTLLFDGDEAGIAATYRAMEVGLECGTVLYGATLPQGMDPDEVILGTGPQKSGKEEMQAILSAAQPLLDAGIEEALRLAGKSSEDRVQALKRLGGWLNRFKDPIGREVRIQHIQKALGVSRGLIEGKSAVSLDQREGPKMNRTPGNKGGIVRRGGVNSRSGLTAAEKMILGGLIYGGSYVKILSEMKERMPLGVEIPELLHYVPARDFVSRIISEAGFLERIRSIPDTVVDADLDIQIRSVLTEALLWENPPFSEGDFRAAVTREVSKVWARFSQRIKKEISEAELNKDVELQSRLMKDYLDVQRKMKDFSSFYDQE